ncbi:MAG: hypothetical protein J6M02_04365 [Clostridia bacterium]|nr:hypothetical protein [Clostridia bacterium]
MCYYRTYKDGSLVTPNVEAEKVELLYRIKSFVAYFDVPSLSRFVAEAERKLFQDEGRHFREWLAGMSPEGVKEILSPKELQHGQNDGEQNVLQLLEEFLTP